MKTKSYSLWINDYKPKNFEDIIGNEDFISLIKLYIENMNDIPNMILNGENGTGKKTLAKIIANKYQDNPDFILYLDSNLNKNKDIIKNNGVHTSSYDVLSFAQKKCCKKKIIIINNFEELSEDSQHSLRNIIEKYNQTTIFILTSNNKSDIIESIQSRFLIFNIKKLSKDNIIQILYNIISTRHDINLNITNPDLNIILDTIYIFSNGDIKLAINYLQMFSYSINPTIQSFFKMFNIPSFVKITNMIQYTKDISNNKFAYSILNELLLEGHNPNDILQIIIKIITLSDDENKHKYLEMISNIYIQMDIYPTIVQLMNLLRKFSSFNKKYFY